MDPSGTQMRARHMPASPRTTLVRYGIVAVQGPSNLVARSGACAARITFDNKADRNPSNSWISGRERVQFGAFSSE